MSSSLLALALAPVFLLAAKPSLQSAKAAAASHQSEEQFVGSSGGALDTGAVLRGVLKSFEAVEPHMGTLFRIKLYAATVTEAQAAFHAAFARITDLDRELSDYLPDSELNRATREASLHGVPISTDLYRVLAKAQLVASQTGGAFDVTIGPLTHLWRAGRQRSHLPDPEAVQQALAHTGYGKLHLERATQTMRLDAADMQLDLGGIAKGYAADEALRVVEHLGIDSALVAASGDLAFSNAPPHERGWKIAIDAADKAGAAFTQVMLLSNAAVSTSGDTEQHLDTATARYSHIIDPKTGMGLVGAPAVTVIARRGIDADAAATATSALGCKEGMAYIEKHPGLAALFYLRNTRSVQSSRFRRLAGSLP